MPIATESGANFTPVPEGNYTATCIRVIDLGTQRTTYKGTEKHMRKVLIVWEVPEVRAKDKDENDMPALIFQRYTLSLSDKALLRAHLKAWRGREFTKEELAGFEVANVLGKSCLMQIVHQESGGNTYANIAAIMSLPKGTPAPTPEHALINFDLQKFGDGGVFESLSERLQDQIMESPEYKAIMKARGGGGGDGFEPDPHAGFDPDDEIPFVTRNSLR